MEIGNIKSNIKTAIENANLCGKICDMHTLLNYAKMRQSHICIKLTCLACTLCYSCGQQSYAYD